LCHRAGSKPDYEGDFTNQTRKDKAHPDGQLAERGWRGRGSTQSWVEACPWFAEFGQD